MRRRAGFAARGRGLPPGAGVCRPGPGFAVRGWGLGSRHAGGSAGGRPGPGSSRTKTGPRGHPGIFSSILPARYRGRGRGSTAFWHRRAWSRLARFWDHCYQTDNDFPLNNYKRLKRFLVKNQRNSCTAGAVFRKKYSFFFLAIFVQNSAMFEEIDRSIANYIKLNEEELT